MAEEKPKARVDRPKVAFLAVVGLSAVALVLLLAKLPESWQTAAILWLIAGLPLMFFLLRLWRGYVQMTLADLARSPQPPPSAIRGVGERSERPELRVVEGSDGKAGRRLL
jgi:hypothetical protein